MTHAFKITRPDGEKWEMIPDAMPHESSAVQWWKLFRDGRLACATLVPVRCNRREIIGLFEVATDKTKEVKIL